MSDQTTGVIIKAGTMVHIKGIPVWLSHDTPAQMNVANIPLTGAKIYEEKKVEE